MSDFGIDIKGRLNNTKLPDTKNLLPLFEAIVNSIQSINDTNITNGVITIYAERGQNSQIKISSESNELINDDTPFYNFIIEDNGHGFTKDHYKSFCTADSTYKIEDGCKGIGRFLWLKAFKRVQIESCFTEDNLWKKRKFGFSEKGISPDENLENSDKTQNVTTIRLEGFISKYRHKCTKSLEIIANKIIEHCLTFFILGRCPSIIIKDNLGGIFQLNDIFKVNIQDTSHSDKFKINDNDYTIFHFKLYTGAKAHELHLCANSREVKSFNLKNYVPNLQRKIDTQSDKDFYYCGFILSSFLDSTVNSSRIDFDLHEEDLIESERKPFEIEIVEQAKIYIERYLSEEFKEIDDNKEIYIKDFVTRKKPKYHYLIKNRPDIIKNLKPHLSENELDIALYQQTNIWEIEVMKKGEELNNLIAISGFKDNNVMENFVKYCSEITDLSKCSLCEYVARRKIILEEFKKALEVREDGAYHNESCIHSLICPMRYSSDDISFQDVNLWIIDERLLYHSYIASDYQLKKIPYIDSNSMYRVDIAIFNHIYAFSDTENDFRSVIIIEFKKPDRNDLNNHNSDPIKQVLAYVDGIIKGTEKRANGRPFGYVQNTAFYCYIIADLTNSMINAAKSAGMIQTNDGQGYFIFNPGYKAYIEVISYNKLIQDAEYRNKIFFEKLENPNPSEILFNNHD